MSKPSSRGAPLAPPPRPLTMLRSARSFTSSARRQLTRRGSRPSALPQNRWLSTIAASRLFAAVMAWKSPVKWRLISSIGATCARPPPVAPPFWPKQGPMLGSRRQIIVRCPSAFSASPKPDGGGRLALTGGGGADAGDEHQRAVGPHLGRRG